MMAISSITTLLGASKRVPQAILAARPALLQPNVSGIARQASAGATHPITRRLSTLVNQDDLRGEIKALEGRVSALEKRLFERDIAKEKDHSNILLYGAFAVWAVTLGGGIAGILLTVAELKEITGIK